LISAVAERGAIVPGNSGVRSEVSHLAFEPDILDALPEPPARHRRLLVRYRVVRHQQRIALLLAVAER